MKLVLKFFKLADVSILIYNDCIIKYLYINYQGIYTSFLTLCREKISLNFQNRQNWYSNLTKSCNNKPPFSDNLEIFKNQL